MNKDNLYFWIQSLDRKSKSILVKFIFFIGLMGLLTMSSLWGFVNLWNIYLNHIGGAIFMTIFQTFISCWFFLVILLYKT